MEVVVFSTNFRLGFEAQEFQTILPKNLIHRVVNGEPIYDFFQAWKQSAEETASMKNFGLKQWFVSSAEKLSQKGYKIDFHKKWLSKGWLSENKLTEEQLAKQNPAKTYGLAFLFSLIISYNLAFFLGDSATNAVWGATAGFLAGFGWSTLIFAIIALFEQKSWKYIFINGGFITVDFTLIGFMLGIWR